MIFNAALGNMVNILSSDMNPFPLQLSITSSYYLNSTLSV